MTKSSSSPAPKPSANVGVQGILRGLGLLDAALAVTAMLWLIIQAPLIFLLLLFIWLTLGASRWSQLDFIWRAVLWILVATAIAVYQSGAEQLLSILLLTAILALVYFIVRRRANAEEQNESLRHELELRLNELVNAKSELERTRNKADDDLRLRAEFLASTGHELRAPLNAVIGYSEILTELAQENSYAPEVTRDLERIRTSGLHLLGFINNILDLSRLQAGKTEVFLEAFDVPKFARECAATVRALVEQNGNQLIVECDENFGTMRADLTKTQYALTTLLNNAAKFTTNGQITLEVSREVGRGTELTVFTVSDTGIGMTQEQLDNLFQEFRPVDTSVLRKYGGTGLSLMVAHRFCQAMGGNILATSEQGKGSTFLLAIPSEVVGRFTQRTVEQRHAHQTERADEKGAGLVLTIDDDVVVRDVVARTLSREGFVVETAPDGEAGLQRATELKPDVITLDVFMPGLDGWQVLVALKANAELAHIPVIMLTTVGENRNKGYTLGAAGYLDKPVNREQLIETLKKYRRDGAK
jgi:signal transduction histidine kinase/ActR/RegA family two-component response regulator